MSDRNVSWAMIALIGTVLALLLVICGEVTMRIYERVKTGSWDIPYYLDARNIYNHMYVRASFPPYRLRPNSKIIGENNHVDVSINSFGYRQSDSMQVHKRPGTFRIICYGGSATFGYFIPSNELTWPSQLEKILSTYGLDVEVINAGVPGYSSWFVLFDFIGLGRGLDPDALIVYEGWNDIRVNENATDKIDPFQSGYSKLPSSNEKDDLPLWKCSFLISKVMSRLKIPQWQSRVVVKGIHQAEEPGVRGVAACQRQLEDLGLIASQSGISVIFIPELINLDHSLAKQCGLMGSAGFSRRTVELCAKEYRHAMFEAAEKTGCRYWELDAEIKLDGQNFCDEVHLTPQGAKIFAETVATRLLPLIQDKAKKE